MKSESSSGRERLDLQNILLEAVRTEERVNPRSVFVLGAPRTGSTWLYQAICGGLELPFISNLTNDLFPDAPIVGLAIQKSVPVRVGQTSKFGKTEGPFQPSEASSVISNWFGGGHPSQVVSNSFLPGRKEHFYATLAAAEVLFGAPLVIKNAWNCFRISCLATALPSAHFVWVRRDRSLMSSAKRFSGTNWAYSR